MSTIINGTSNAITFPDATVQNSAGLSVGGTIASGTVTTLTTTTISDGTNSTSSTNCIKGSAKAWVVFDGTGPTIRSSFNVSSVTRQATGQFTINMTTAMVDINYVVCGSLINGTTAGIDGGAWVGGSDQSGSNPGSQTTTSFTIGTFTYPVTFKNFPYTNIMVLR